jgi:hypothetical protein
MFADEVANGTAQGVLEQHRPVNAAEAGDVLDVVVPSIAKFVICELGGAAVFLAAKMLRERP